MRSPGAGSTPGPLSQQQPQGLDTSDPGKSPEPSDCHKTLRYAGKFSHKTIIIVVRLAVQQVVLGYIIFRRGSVRWKLFMGHWIKMTVEITTCWLNYVGSHFNLNFCRSHVILLSLTGLSVEQHSRRNVINSPCHHVCRRLT